MIERSEELVLDPLERGLRILAEMLEEAADIRTLRDVQPSQGEGSDR